MKAITLILLSLTVGWSSAYLIRVPTLPTKTRIAPVGWVHIQKLMLPLFDNVCEDSTNTVIMQLAKDFNLDASNGDYTKPGVVEYLRNLKTTQGFLPKGEIFTEYNKDHVNELKAVFELFYYAKDFDTFYRAAAWARQNINCGLFIDAIYLAVVNRRDTEKVSVPAPYELMPNYFINRDVVVKTSFLLTGDEVNPEDDVRVEGNFYILDAKYTSDINDGDEDAKLAYFREDIGLNSYYFIRKLRNSPWLNTQGDTNNYRGERMFQMMKQFAARYDLERYSNNLPELEGFAWDSAVGAYDPMLIYSNGNEFNHRSYPGKLDDNEDVTFLKTIENSLSSVVSHLRQAGHDKSQILNHLIELLVASDKSYETVSRKLLGYGANENERQLSVLEHYMTTMRDPVFWRINKKIVQLIDSALKVLPTYTRNELYFPGVEVVNVEVKKMMTSFDDFQFDVTDSLKTATANTTFQVKIAQPRLNNKPFTIKLNISSLVTKKSYVKIYLGPKMMPGELALKKHLFVLLDMFELSLKRGPNMISRSSEQMSFSDDFMSLRTLKKKVEDAEFGLDALPLKTVESQIGYPSRLTLPKGLPEGLPLQLFVFVAPFTKSTIGGSTSMANMELNTAILSPGYPLDLSIGTRQLFGLPNAFVKDIVITHKTASKPSGGYGGRPIPSSEGKPYDNSRPDLTIDKEDHNEVFQSDNMEEYNYDDSLLVHGLVGDRPDFTYKKTNNDYSAKKNQYRKTNDYATKRTDYRNKASDSQYRKVDVSDETIVENIKKDELADYKIPKNDHYVLPTHGLLGERPVFTYKNKDTTSDSYKNQYRTKEDYTTKRVEYKKRDFQDTISKEKTDENFKFSEKNNDFTLLKHSNDKVISDKSDKKVNLEVSYEDTLHSNEPPVHGLLGKSTDDPTVIKNKYEIKKDNYVRKAETKSVEYRKKAFDKKAKIGVLDYSLLDQPEDSTYIQDIDVLSTSTSVEDEKHSHEIDDKKALEKKIYEETIGDKAFKQVKNKAKPKETFSDTISDKINKIDNKVMNKDIDGTMVPNAAKDKYFYKVIKDDSEEIDLYENDGFAKTINKNIVQNKEVTTKSNIGRDINEATENTVRYDIDGYAKTINKDIAKDKNRNKVIKDVIDPKILSDNSIEKKYNDYVPRTTTESTKKRVSVYDYIFYPQNYFEEDVKVYE